MANGQSNSQTHISFGRAALIACLFGGIGGTLPSLSNIAGQMIVQDAPPLPNPHIILPILIFFFIGVVLNVAFNSKDWEIGKALVIGISAPGIITNYVNGAHGDKQSQPVSSPAISQKAAANTILPLIGISTAYAQDLNATKPVEPVSPNVASLRTINIRVDVEGVSSDYLPPVSVKITPASDQKELGTSQFDVNSAPYSGIIQIPKEATRLNVVILALGGSTFSSGTIVGIPQNDDKAGPTPVTLRVKLDLSSTAAGDAWWALGAKRAVLITGASVTLNGVDAAQTLPPICRVATNGVDHFDFQIIRTNSSGWRGGGYNQVAYCNDLIGSLKSQYPQISDTQILSSSEESRKQFFGHVEYNYTCTVRVAGNPVFKLGPSKDCADGSR